MADDLRTLCAATPKDVVPDQAEVMHALREDLCVHELIGRQVSDRPDNTAISAWDGDLSYRQLDARSRDWAAMLRALGCPDGTSIIHCMSHSKLAIVAYLGIIRAGHVCVPLDPGTPIPRIEEVTRIAEASAIICNESLTAKLNGKIEHVISYEKAGVPETSLDTRDVEVSPSSPALIIFTSGSSGTPKGVVQQHSKISKSLVAMSEALAFDDCTRSLNFASYSFDASVNEIFTALVVGGCVCIPSEEQRLQDLPSFMSDFRVTHASLTSTVAATVDPDSVPSLKQLSLGGEMASRGLLESWADKVQLNIIYGSTEGAVWDTIATGVTRDSDPSNIGRPIESHAWILHPEDPDTLSPFGTVGELYIQSDLLSTGYLGQGSNKPAHSTPPPSWMTKAHDMPQSILYGTGDLARFNEDGSIVLLGRKDNQVKLHGQRIDLCDVEYRIKQHLDEKAEIVVDVIDNGNDQRLAVFGGAERENSNDSTTSELQEKLNDAIGSLGTTVPKYMIPDVVIAVESIPKTTSMKVDRRSLQRLGLEHTEQERTNGLEDLGQGCDAEDELFNALKELVCDVVCPHDEPLKKSLKNHDIELHRLGVSSIQAVTLTRSIQRKFQVDVPIHFMLTHGVTCWDLRNAIHDRRQSKTAAQSDHSLHDSLAEWKQKLSSLLTQNLDIVFVTGATGYLGNEILRQLLCSTHSGRIAVHVRAETQEDALSRLRSAGERRGWWKSFMQERLEVWLGDLSKYRLGLDDSQWDSLFGEFRVAIIHNGAVVDWAQSYHSLQQTNVKSTFEILTGMLGSKVPPRLTYVSGGYLSPAKETEGILVQKLSDWPGYDQTKFVSEALIRQYNQHVPGGDAHIVKPGYIIGTQDDGASQPGDTFWRLLKSCARIGYYSEADAKSWITIAGVNSVAIAIVNDALHRDTTVDTHNETKILDGVLLADIWGVLNSLGVTVKPLSHAHWLNKILDDIESEAEKHPLYPLHDWITQSHGLIGGDQPDHTQLLIEKGQVRRCVDASLRAMAEEGIFGDACSSRS
jgi:amino acid adenylation domain-containing protein/thioester reductase-like protein